MILKKTCHRPAQAGRKMNNQGSNSCNQNKKKPNVYFKAFFVIRECKKVLQKCKEMFIC